MASIHRLAQVILEQLAPFPESGEIVLGGYFALRQYVDYRPTHDIDAWWKTRAVPATESAIRTVMERLALAEGIELRERRFGETLSFELHRAGRKHFSFQIAVRSVQLDPPVPSPWSPILMETLADNIGAKMNALVERGAARDFTDIRQAVTSGLCTIQESWNLWKRKNPDESTESAKRKVLIHLTALEARRPLESISEPQERQRAKETREWFRHQFLGCTK
jgi:hypothetical protein